MYLNFFSCQKHLILLIKGLCTGCSRLDRTEIITFTAMMKSAKLPQTVKTLSDGACSFTWPGFSATLLARFFPFCLLVALPSSLLLLLYFIVEDQKELASPISPELRQKEVQMNFLNQLTSVFNPRTVASSPVGPQTPVSYCSQMASSCGVFVKMMILEKRTSKRILYLWYEMMYMRMVEKKLKTKQK